MSLQDGKRFRLSLCGYNRAAVDAEFDRLLERNESLGAERQSMQQQLDSLTEERTAISREQVQLNTTITAMTGQVVELESNLNHVKNENETLVRAIEAHKAEKNAMQIRYDQLRERDR
ncbi:MAG: hypothetical protein IJP17_02440, partial [Clostridia bacterium]|nr:hypothetical protein [Clostridia bacterium]